MWYCVPTHTVRKCDIFCILVLIWAEELNARTKQMGTKAFHLWLHHYMKGSGQAVEIYKRSAETCITWEMSYMYLVSTFVF